VWHLRLFQKKKNRYYQLSTTKIVEPSRNQLDDQTKIEK